MTQELSLLIEEYKNPGKKLGGLFSKIRFNKKLNDEVLSLTSFLDNINNVKLTERLYCLINNINYNVTCSICGNHAKYTSDRNYLKTCGNKECLHEYQKHMFDDYDFTEAVKKHQQTCLKKYGVKSHLSLDEFKEKKYKTCEILYGDKTPLSKNAICREKGYETKMKIYGGIGFDSPIITNKKEETCLKKYNNKNFTNVAKAKETCIKKYGVDSVFKSPEIRERMKQTLIKKYGVDNILKNDNIKQIVKQKLNSIETRTKIYNTLKRNNSFNKSKKEDKLYEILCQIFDKDNVIRQYRSEVYPFNCDFYIKDLDLYIEGNFSWTHGQHPFDETNSADLDILQKWKNKSNEINFKGCRKKFYLNAINTWTIGDVKKRNTAKENNLNYIEIWNIDDIYKKLNKYIYEQ